jgi:hypothetical protein
MAEVRKDALAECLFDRKEARLTNVKFFRGSNDVISEADFRAQAHAAIVQMSTKAAKSSDTPPVSDRPSINVRELVAKV